MTFAKKVKTNLEVLIQNKWASERDFCENNLIFGIDEVKFFSLSSNTIWIIQLEGETYFFRPCIKKLPLKEYFSFHISFFFERIIYNFDQVNFSQTPLIPLVFDPSAINGLYHFIKEHQNQPDFFNKIANIDLVINEEGISIWKEGKISWNHLAEQIGISDIPVAYYDILPIFLWYLKGVASNYRRMKFIPNGKYSFFSGSKSMATSELANILGIQGIVTESKLCRIKYADSEWGGVLSSCAFGNRSIDVNCDISPIIQRDLTTLNLFDVICFQKDHGPNNYNVINVEEGKLSRTICAFDNDNPSTFAPVLNVYFGSSGCSPFFKKGKTLVNRPHLERGFLKKILEIKNNDLIKLKRYLNPAQFFALEIRIFKIKRIIKNEIKRNESFAFDEKDWSPETIEDEILNYDCTYLKRFVDRTIKT